MKMSIDKLKKMLNKQETILSYVYCSVQLTHSSRSGLLVATDKKVWFCADSMFGKGQICKFEYEKIDSLSYNDGIVFGALPFIKKIIMKYQSELIIFDKFSDFDKAKAFYETVNNKIHNKQVANKENETELLEGIEVITNALKDFSLRHITHIQSFNLSYVTEFGIPTALLHINFIITYDDKRYVTTFEFKNSKSINFESTGEYHQISLRINDIRERGWEDKKFEVEDYEEGSLSFFCEQIKVISLKETTYNV